MDYVVQKGQLFATTLTLVLTIIGTILWYRIKEVLNKKGYKVSYIYGHFRDLIKFYELIQKEANRLNKRRYYIMLVSLVIVIILFMVCVLYLMSIPI